MLSVFALFTRPSFFDQLEKFEEEQEAQYDRYYDEQQRQGIGHLLISYLTSSTVYLIVDFADRIKIRPGRRVSRAITAGHHILAAYDEDLNKLNAVPSVADC